MTTNKYPITHLPLRKQSEKLASWRRHSSITAVKQFTDKIKSPPVGIYAGKGEL